MRQLLSCIKTESMHFMINDKKNKMEISIMYVLILNCIIEVFHFNASIKNSKAVVFRQFLLFSIFLKYLRTSTNLDNYYFYNIKILFSL